MAAEVTAFLRAHPTWLAENPALYAVLAPPQRVHGDIFADHMAAMLRAARANAVAMSTQADDVLTASRAAAGMTERVQEAVLALMHAADPGECITAELPGLLGIDAVTLCVETSGAAIPPGSRKLSPDSVMRLLGTRDVVFRAQPGEGAGLLHGEAVRLAQHDALVRVKLPGPPALLALAARDPLALHAGQGAAALAFLGRAVAAALVR
jgi:uncharacterized protein YigA (DUF484 family)